MPNSKKILIFAFLVLLFVSLSGFVFAKRAIEVTYPDIPGTIRPTETKALLTDYIKYIFNFAIMISGLIAFGALIYGGFRYVTSAGSPTALSDAKDQIGAGVLGLIILLSSYLILTTVNPQLVILTAGLKVDWGITLYANPDCPEAGKEGEDFLRVTKDTPDLGDFNNKAYSIKFRTSRGTLDLWTYPQINYLPKDGYSRLISEDADNNMCFNINREFVKEIKSIKFIWKLPGVYLVREGDGVERFLPADTATLGDFDDKVAQVKFNNSTHKDENGNTIVDIKYGAVFHEHQDWKGACNVYLAGDSPVSTSSVSSPVGKGVSSVTTFTQSTELIGEGVTFYENDDLKGTPWGPFKPGDYSEKSNVKNCRIKENARVGCNYAEVNMPKNRITSLKIQGNYIAILFEGGDGDAFHKTCQVFTRSDSNLRDDEMGRCGCFLFGWQCGDCLSSFIILPTK